MFKVKRKSIIYLASAGLMAFLGFFTAASVSFAADTTAPKISEIKMVKGDDYGNAPFAVFSWKTNEKTNGKVEYGTVSGVYTKSVAEQKTGLLTHQVNISDLEFDTTYYFKISAIDLANNAAASEEYSYATPIKDPIKILKVKVLDVLADSAIVNVSLNRKAAISVSAKNSNNETEGSAYYLYGEGPYDAESTLLIKGLKPSTDYSLTVNAQYEIYNPNDPDTYPYDLVQAEPLTGTTIKTSPAPEVIKMDKTKGARGTLVTVKGKYFGKDFDIDQQKLVAAVGCDIETDGRTACPAEIVYWNDSEIQFIVNERSQTGIVNILNNYHFEEHLYNRGDYSLLNDDYFPAMALPGPEISDQEKKAMTFSILGAANVKSIVAKSYGCGFSATARKANSRYAKTIRVSKLFRQGDKTDAYFKSVYDLYKTNWKRAPRCEELQFHYDHKTPLQKLTAWLKSRKPKN